MTQTVNFQPRLLKEGAAAAILNVEVTTLRRWRWAGKGPRFVKLGSAVRYQDAIPAFLDRREPAGSGSVKRETGKL